MHITTKLKQIMDTHPNIAPQIMNCLVEANDPRMSIMNASAIAKSVWCVADTEMKMMSEKVSNSPCVAGCSYCCHQYVGVNHLETEAIYDIAHAKMDWDAIESLVHVKTVKDYWDKQIPCPMLKDNLCIIYDCRPSVCRTQMVAHSDSSLCMPSNTGTTPYYPMWKSEVAMSVMASISFDRHGCYTDAFPRMLLKIRKKKNAKRKTD